ncbi:MAG: glycoside hydrolase family 16 protein [Candidatus Nanopelagicales bacterium]|nr:glycoside hydrolase family 16 protein [Candidatus Nanopelagicales bacterium]MDZ4250838.1 glycoside hydrolase family 16 protein [Candidatus Nanopelagicales bacterium]
MSEKLRIATALLASTAIAFPVVGASASAAAVAPTPAAAVSADLSAASPTGRRVYLLKGKIGRGKSAKASRVAAKSAVSKRKTKRRVVAGTVSATAKFAKDRCAPVSVRLGQNGTKVAREAGSGQLKAKARVKKGKLNVAVTSASCRTKYKVKLVNVKRKPKKAPPVPSGMPVGDLPGWKSVFAEDFNTTAPLGSFLSTYSNFGAYPYPWTDTSRQERSNPGYYHPGKTLSVASGVLDAWLHYDSELGRYLVAAPTPSLPEMTYGRFSMRLRAEKIPGYKIAPLLWPDSESWPDDGEIDFPEGDLTGDPLKAFHHYARAAGGQDQFSAGVKPGAWHVYETLWSPGKVEFLVDGKSIGSSTKYVPSKPMHWVLQMETQIESTAPSKSAEGHVQVDWVKAYTYSPA